MSIGTRLLTWISGTFVGEDELGNRYFRDLKHSRNGREKRWVIYKNQADGSAVPAAWHGWLHHRIDLTPNDTGVKALKWQRRHEINPTGTDAAYRQPGHVLNKGERTKASGDYQAWQPVEQNRSKGL